MHDKQVRTLEVASRAAKRSESTSMRHRRPECGVLAEAPALAEAVEEGGPSVSTTSRFAQTEPPPLMMKPREPVVVSPPTAKVVSRREPLAASPIASEIFATMCKAMAAKSFGVASMVRPTEAAVAASTAPTMTGPHVVASVASSIPAPVGVIAGEFRATASMKTASETPTVFAATEIFPVNPAMFSVAATLVVGRFASRFGTTLSAFTAPIAGSRVASAATGRAFSIVVPICQLVIAAITAVCTFRSALIHLTMEAPSVVLRPRALPHRSPWSIFFVIVSRRVSNFVCSRHTHLRGSRIQSSDKLDCGGRRDAPQEHQHVVSHFCNLRQSAKRLG